MNYVIRGRRIRICHAQGKRKHERSEYLLLEAVGCRKLDVVYLRLRVVLKFGYLYVNTTYIETMLNMNVRNA